jgi:predicted dehydrogenase
MSNSPVKILIVGAGNRGTGYAQNATKDGLAEIVGIAEPREARREHLVEEFNIPRENVFSDWKEAVAKEKFCDAVVIATQDSMHTEPALAFASKGYHMLLEKPLAPTPEECEQICQAAIDNDIIFSVGHVLRYTPYTQKLKEIIESGVIGEVVSLQHLEPVTYWHQAHSYVRGNWRNEKESSFMLLAKSCHDIDWIRYIMNGKISHISSFGSLHHFKKENRPEKAADRCLDCEVENECPYSAKRIYMSRIEKGEKGWPVDVITDELTEEGVMEALRSGPYGRCVYDCDNDVVDHQVVNLEFNDGRTASMTMTAFNIGTNGRKTNVFGTKGELLCDGKNITHVDFLTEERKEICCYAGEGMASDGHGGGDYGLTTAFVKAVATGDRSHIVSGPEETLETHLAVFAAEKSRLERSVKSI